MNTKIDRRQLAVDLCYRSSCRIKMAAILSDKVGIFSWGWNNPGPEGFGTHAEEHAINRANRKRLKGATITVAGFRDRTIVFARPCEERCLPLLKRLGIKEVEFLDKGANWRIFTLR